jgi:predicted MFS family arabinose efflux permease
MNQAASLHVSNDERVELDRALLAILSVSAGLAVANVYYNQSMLGRLAAEFDLSAGVAASISVVTQFGNAIGVILIAPLGDCGERKRLILLTVAALVVALVGAAIAPSFTWLVVASFLVGLFGTVAQQIVPLSVHVAPAQAKGQVLGIVTAGILVGILLSRTISGIVTDWWNWRIMFAIAAAIMSGVGAALAWKLPKVQPITRLPYVDLLGSFWPLLRDHGILRYAIAIQALVFGAFLAFWSNLAVFLSRKPFSLGASAVGLIALAGATGALAAPIAGRIADKRGPDLVIIAGALTVAVAFVLLAAFRQSLAVLVIGVVIMDVGVQASQVANQARVHALDPAARSRLNTIFMASMLFGGAIGAGIGGSAFSRFGWAGPCVLGTAAATAALVLALIESRQRRISCKSNNRIEIGVKQ